MRRFGVCLVAVVWCVLMVNSQALARNFDGLYAGGLAGVSTFNTEADYRGLKADSLGMRGEVGGVFAGYSLVSNWFYSGFEANGAFNNNEYELQYSSFALKGDVEHQYGFNIRMGTILHDVAATYALIGWQRARIELDNSATGWSSSEDFDGLRAGLGIEYPALDNIFIRGEYAYTFYGEETLKDMGYKVDLKPSSGEFTLGVGFRF